MFTKKLLYVDQNYLSNMAKAKYNLSPAMSKSDKEFYIEMFGAIERAVGNNRLACPGLEYQLVEASFDTRLRDGIARVLSALTLDLNFLPQNRLLFNQMLDAAREYMQRPPSSIDPWEKVFDADPDTKIQIEVDTLSDARPNLVIVHAPLVERLVEHNRRIKESFRPGIERIKKSRGGATKGTWNEELRSEKVDFISNYIGPMALHSSFR